MSNPLSSTNSRMKIRLLPLCFTFSLFFGIASVRFTFAAPYQSSWPIYSEILGGESWYVVKKNDSLYSISGRDGSTWQYLARRNNLNPFHNLSIDQRLVVNNRHIIPQNQVTDGLLLNIPEHRLYLFEQGNLIRRFPVGVGRFDWPTPVGSFVITGKFKNRTWTVPKSIQEEMKRSHPARITPWENIGCRYRFQGMGFMPRFGRKVSGTQPPMVVFEWPPKTLKIFLAR
jgi:LysM repeat protein